MSFTESLEDLVARNPNGLLSAHPNWGRVPLGLVFDVQNGFPFESRYFNASGNGKPLLRIRDVARGSTETHYSGEYDSAFIVNRGEIIVGMDGDFNCRVWRGAPALLNQRVCRLSSRGDYYLSTLLVQVLQGYLDAVNGKTSAITVKHLSSQTIKDIPLPLPPREEQQRIAEAIDSYLTRLDNAVASLERVQASLKLYRAAVLKAAVEGRLVPTEASLARAEKRDYEPADALLGRMLKERRRRWEEAELAKLRAAGKTPKDAKWKANYEEPVAPDTSKLATLPEGWCWASLGLMKEFSLYGPRFSSDEYAEEGVLVLRTTDISESGRVNLATPPRLNLSRLDFERYQAKRGDLLITRTGSLGTLAVLEDDVRAIAGAYLIQYRLAAPTETTWYSFYFLKSPRAQMHLVRGGQGVGRPNLNVPTIDSILIPLPPLAEQVRIIDEIQRLTSTSDEVALQTTADVRRCVRLRQAVLKWAFEGKLADQDPTDEPAEKVLARIRADRAAGPTNKSRARTSKGPA